MAKYITIEINIIHSKEGGDISYSVPTTEERIRLAISEIIRKRIPENHLCSLVIAEKKDKYS